MNMPTYEYECGGCGDTFETFQTFADKPLLKCNKCNKKKLFRVVTGGLHGNVRSIETIGQLADSNAKKNRSKINEEAARKREESPAPVNPWGGKDTPATAREIIKMNTEQKIRYIMKGQK